MPGLDRKVLDHIDFKHIIQRVQTDVRSDFTLAPHYNIIFIKATDALAEEITQRLRSGTYAPKLPLTISVPKERGFTRPGSILSPIDRVIYHALADLTAQKIEDQLDRNRVFSNVVEDISETDKLFQPSQDCWERLQKTVAEMGSSGGFILKADIANYFERLPHHHLINLLTASGVQPEITKLLEEILLAFRQRDSFGIIQGLFPSDLFGNFYLSGLDSHCDLHDILSARFVDDFYLHFNDEIEARRGLVDVQESLRKEGLNLNERKSGIYPAEDLLREETLIDRLFKNARDEIREEWFENQVGYGFAVDWIEESDEPEEADVEVEALTRLYASRNEYPAQSDKIEKLCLPVFRALGNDIALEPSLESLVSKPHLTKLYLSYISRFARVSESVAYRVAELLERKEIYTDFQRMYLLGTLLQANTEPKGTVKLALRYLENRKSSPELRALAAILASKFGTPVQRRAVRTTYEAEQSTYVRCAILYSTRYFTSAERKTCIKAWGSHTIENALVAQVLKSS